MARSHPPARYGPHAPTVPEPHSRGTGVDSNPAAATAWVKRTATELGADAVGVCLSDRQWFGRDGHQHVPLDHRWAVLLAVAMDRAAISLSPGPEAAAATREGYARMDACAPALGEAIGAQGYHAVSAGNGLALSVPLAAAAGLGEVGLHGMLIAPGYSACLRLCKVFTNMPLVPNRPTDLGVRQFCLTCQRCVRACPRGALAQPHTAPDGGAWWKVDGGTCRSFWRELGHSCANCVAACPLLRQPQGDDE